MKTVMKSASKNKEVRTSHHKAAPLQGPSLFEVEYLRQLKEELEIFLRSRNFATIQEVQIAFAGPDYVGQLRVSA